VETVSRNKWTPAEIKYLERYYAWKNVEQIVVGLAQITGVTRTKRSVLSKAYKMLLSDSVPEEYSRLAWAHHNHGKRTKTTFLHRLARREGVLRRQPGGHCNPWIVPTKWLEEKIARNQRWRARVHQRRNPKSVVHQRQRRGTVRVSPATIRCESRAREHDPASHF
jgi:hypothetical protein